MWRNQPQLASCGLQTNNERETLPTPKTPEIHPRTLRRLPSSLCKPSLRTNFDWEDSWNDDYAKRPVLLDLFSGAGGCAFGYYLAGFRIVGVDIKPQKHYPFEFHQADAFEYLREHWREFDAIHASPPCQRYSASTRSWNGRPESHPDLVGTTRLALLETKKPYVIENVPLAPLGVSLMLCGTMFGLNVIRHRYFECNPLLYFPPTQCAHRKLVAPQGRFDPNKYHCITGNFGGGVEEGKRSMGIDWMKIRSEVALAIPPAYTEFIGKRLLEAMRQS